MKITTLNVKFFQFSSGLLSLIYGGLIYMLYRNDTLYLFDLLKQKRIYKYISFCRIKIQQLFFPPNWIIYSLPNGLWIFSATTLLLLIWNNKVKRENVIIFFILPFFGVVTEFAQKFNFISGIFDVYDLLFYLFGFILSIIMFLNFKIIIK